MQFFFLGYFHTLLMTIFNFQKLCEFFFTLPKLGDFWFVFVYMCLLHFTKADFGKYKAFLRFGPLLCNFYFF